MEVGLKIKKYLEESGISQSYICRRTGISQPKLNLALNGKRRLTFDEYSLICGALGVSTARFIEPRTI